MAERLTETQMSSLAEIYRDYACLWNLTSDLYKDRAARDDAYHKIYERLNIPGLTVKDVPKKIKNLRSSYSQELKRIKNCQRSGGIYRPKVPWFKTVESFLKPPRTRTYKDSNSASDSELDSRNPKSEDVPEEDSNTAEETVELDWDATGHPTIVAPREFNETTSPAYITKMVKTRIIDSREDDIYDAVAKIDKIANSLSASTSALLDRREDEFDSFGKYVAAALRALPRELAIAGQTDIQSVVSEVQLRALPTPPAPYRAVIKLEDD